MQHLLQLEWIKHRGSSTFWTMTIIYSAIVLIGLLFILGTPIRSLAEYASNDGLWLYIPYLISYLHIIVGAIIIISIVAEMSNRTWRQHIVDGIERQHMLHSKYIFGAIAALGVTLLSVLIVLLLKLRFSTSGEDTGPAMGAAAALISKNPKGLINLPILFFQAMGYISIAILFGLIFRNAGLAAVAYIVYFKGIEPLITWFIDISQFGFDRVMSGKYNSFTDYFPAETFGSMVGPNISVSGVSGGSVDQSTLYIVAAAYLIIFYLLNRWLILKKDF